MPDGKIHHLRGFMCQTSKFNFWLSLESGQFRWVVNMVKKKQLFILLIFPTNRHFLHHFSCYILLCLKCKWVTNIRVLNFRLDYKIRKEQIVLKNDCLEPNSFSEFFKRSVDWLALLKLYEYLSVLLKIIFFQRLLVP